MAYYIDKEFETEIANIIHHNDKIIYCFEHDGQEFRFDASCSEFSRLINKEDVIHVCIEVNAKDNGGSLLSIKSPKFETGYLFTSYAVSKDGERWYGYANGIRYSPTLDRHKLDIV